ncbi:MAG: hypothetical protein U0441_06870 [Polyangiaceae bacterium]
MRARLSGCFHPSMLVALPMVAVSLGCAGAPPPAEVNKPAPVVAPIATATATASAVTKTAPPPLVIASKYKADPTDPLPAGAVMRCGTNRMRALDPQAIGVTNEGRVLVLDNRDGRSWLMDANRGVKIASLQRTPLTAFSPDASLLFADGIDMMNDVGIFSASTGQLIGRVAIPLKNEMSVKFGKSSRKVVVRAHRMLVSPDGAALVVLATDGTAHVVDVASRKVIKSLPAQPKNEIVSLSRGAARAVVETYERELDTWSVLGAFGSVPRVGIAVIDLRTGATLRKQTFAATKADPTDPDSPMIRPHDGAAYRLSPDGNTLYRLESGGIVAIDVATGKESDVTDEATSGAAGPFGGRLDAIAGMLPPAVRFDVKDAGLAVLDDFVVDLKDGSLKAALDDGFVTISPDGNTAVEKHGLRLARIPFNEDTPPGHETEVAGLAFRPDNRLVSTGQGAFVWSTDDCASREQVSPDAETVAMTPGSGSVVLLTGKNVGILKEDRTVTREDGLPSPQMGALSPDGATLFVAAGGPYDRTTIERRVLAADDPKPSEKRMSQSIQAIAMSPDGELLSVADGSPYSGPTTLHLLSTTPEMGELASASLDDFDALTFAGTGALLTAAKYRGVAVRSPTTLAATRVLHHGYCCSEITASPDGTLAAGASNEGFVVWEVASGRVRGEVPRAHRDTIESLAFSADSKYLATGSRDTTILVWDVAKLSPHVFPKPVTKVSGAADVTGYLASEWREVPVGADGTLKWPSKWKDKPPALKSVTRLASESGAHCAIAEGKVRCWGSTAGGQLGVPEQRTPGKKWRYVEKDVPVTVPVTDPVDLKMRIGYACALQKNGDLVCWGRLKYDAKETAPTTVLTGVKDFDLSAYMPCAVLADGSVKCWGAVEAPNVLSLPGPATAVVGSGGHRCVLFVDGSVRCAGKNDDDQLGDGTGLDQVAYVPVAGLPPATAIAGAGPMTCALTKTAEVMCWGQMGDTSLGRATKIPGLDGATALRVTIWDGICGRIGDRLECVSDRLPR